jgi:hypothetical protein
MSTTIETDYLVVGAGATALAFVDTLLSETDADIVIVDRYDQPGGHWRLAYDFVRLHQPSDFYGVNSRPLGSSAIDQYGSNAGLVNLASGDEIRAYFEAVVRERFLPTGRVRYLPKTEYLGERTARGIISGTTTRFVARRRIVDSTFMKVSVPANRPPRYAVEPGVRVVPPNALSTLSGHDERIVVVGGGKTGIDAVLWLLDRGLDPDRITWVRPRDPWLCNREWAQPGPRFRAVTERYAQASAEAWLQASSLADLLDRLVEAKWLLRISEEVRPTSFRCATVTETELGQLRRVEDFTSRQGLGRIQALRPGSMEFDNGVRKIAGDPLYVDCSANGLARLAPVPVFGEGTITLQPVLTCQQVYSAAFIAHVEARAISDDAKNELAVPVPHPDSETDFLHTWLASYRNEARWSRDPEIMQWRYETRLAGFRTNVGTPLPEAGPARDEALNQVIGFVEAVTAHGDRLIAQEAVTAEGPRPSGRGQGLSRESRRSP